MPPGRKTAVVRDQLLAGAHLEMRLVDPLGADRDVGMEPDTERRWQIGAVRCIGLDRQTICADGGMAQTLDLYGGAV